MAKTLKIWNGRGHGSKYGQGYTMYVAAYSVKQAAELVSKACYDGEPDHVSKSEIRVYYSAGCWGNAMAGIEPTGPCVYVAPAYGPNRYKPRKVI